MKLYEFVLAGTDSLVTLPPNSISTRLYTEILFVTEDSVHMMAMAVMATDITLTDVGGLGLGGAIEC